jgi:hypothetical protein
VDDLDSVDELDKYAAPRLVCIIEGDSEKSIATSTGIDVCIGMISVAPSVGDVVWDMFDGTFELGTFWRSHSLLSDTPMRIELEASPGIMF